MFSTRTRGSSRTTCTVHSSIQHTGAAPHLLLTLEPDVVEAEDGLGVSHRLQVGGVHLHSDGKVAGILSTLVCTCVTATSRSPQTFSLELESWAALLITPASQSNSAPPRPNIVSGAAAE